MRVGLYIRLFGRPGTNPPPPDWPSIRDQALAAEAAGFDLVVLEDALLYLDDDGNMGVWESVSMAAAVAAVTTTVGIGHAVINSPYRHPALVAKVAATLDEISGGRYTLGIGLGNTPDDYPLFGIDADRRHSRFVEAIQIITDLLRTGRTDFIGEFYRAPGAELVLGGPRAGRIPIVVAGGKPKMLRTVARYADEWNWWVSAPGLDEVGGVVRELDRACQEVGRDPATLGRSLDVFNVAAPGAPPPPSGDVLQVEGSAGQVAETLLGYRDLGFEELRINLRASPEQPRTEAIEWAADVVARLHAA